MLERIKKSLGLTEDGYKDLYRLVQSTIEQKGLMGKTFRTLADRRMVDTDILEAVLAHPTLHGSLRCTGILLRRSGAQAQFRELVYKVSKNFRLRERARANRRSTSSARCGSWSIAAPSASFHSREVAAAAPSTSLHAREMAAAVPSTSFHAREVAAAASDKTGTDPLLRSLGKRDSRVEPSSVTYRSNRRPRRARTDRRGRDAGLHQSDAAGKLARLKGLIAKNISDIDRFIREMERRGVNNALGRDATDISILRDGPESDDEIDDDDDY